MRIRLVFTLVGVSALQAAGLELKPETLKNWDGYVRKATAALQQRSTTGQHFLWVDDDAERLAKVRQGEIVIWPARDNNPKCVPSGLIHDWIGAMFIPHARYDDLLTVVRDYPTYKEIYKPGVLDAKLLQQTPSEDRFWMLLRNGSYFTKTVIDGDYLSTYFRVDQKRWYSIGCATRVQEIDSYGQPGQHELPVDQGNGYIWRICGLSQYEERDGGLYVNEEMIALSRDIPAAFRWFVTPIVRRVAKESVALSIDKTRAAVEARLNRTNVSQMSGGSASARSCVSTRAAGCFR